MTAPRATHTVRLRGGAELRIHGRVGTHVVLGLNGTTRAERPGDWGASIAWIVGELARHNPETTFAELRYRVKSWRRLDLCIPDAHEALGELRAQGASSITPLGFSGGGAVALAIAGEADVPGIVGLAPWLPREVEPTHITGKRVAVFHGTLDGLPFLPGTSPRAARAALARLARRGADVAFTEVRGGIHGIAWYGPGGSIVRLPKARTWLRLVGDEVALTYEATARS